MSDIKLKGTSDALKCIIPEDISNSEIRDNFRLLMGKAEHVLENSQVIMDFQGRPVDMSMVGWVLKRFIVPNKMTVLSWKTLDRGTQELFKSAGLKTDEPKAAPETGQKPLIPALVINRSLRSGQRLEHGGDVIVCGHVNFGAEVLAKGHVVVLGKLQGVIHAGMDGDEATTITARQFSAIQVRIGCRIGSMSKEAPWWGKSVILSVEDDAVIVNNWPSMQSHGIGEENF